MQMCLQIRRLSVHTENYCNNFDELPTFFTQWCSWLRHCATSWKVAGSIPDGVNGIFHWHNTSGRTMALGVDSASNRNEYQEYFLGGKGGWCVGLTTLPPSCADCLEIWEPQPPGTFRDCFTFCQRSNSEKEGMEIVEVRWSRRCILLWYLLFQGYAIGSYSKPTVSIRTLNAWLRYVPFHVLHSN
jgi:hypothetical protein